MKLPFKFSLYALGLCLSLGALAARAEPGVSADSIIIGQSAAFTGSPAEEVKQTTDGARLYFDIVNRQGGVFGRKIVLESLDDGFQPQRTVENTRRLLSEKNAFALFLYRGTPTTETVLPLIRDARVPLIAPVTGASSLHEPMQRYLFNLRPLYRDEVRSAIEQLSAMGLQRLAIFYSNDSFGKDALEGVKSAVKALHLPEPTYVSYERNTLAVNDAVKTVFAAKPQAVLMICTAKACGPFVRKYREAGGFQQLITLSNVSSQAFLQDLGKDARGLGMTQVFPNPRNNTIPISKEFQEALKTQSGPEASYPGLEGFVAAKVLVEGLKKAGPKLTREGLVQALEGFKGLDLGGLTLHYSPSSRDGSRYIELTVIGKNGFVVR